MILSAFWWLLPSLSPSSELFYKGHPWRFVEPQLDIGPQAEVGGSKTRESDPVAGDLTGSKRELPFVWHLAMLVCSKMSQNGRKPAKHLGGKPKMQKGILSVDFTITAECERQSLLASEKLMRLSIAPIKLWLLFRLGDSFNGF